MSSDSHDDSHQHSHIIVPWRVYGLNALALAILMGLTIAMAYVNLPYNLNLAVAITIAVLKAMLIILFFMNVKYSTKLTWVFVGSAFFWLFILIGMFLPDYISRDFPHQPDAWQSSPYAVSVAPIDKRVVTSSAHGEAAHGEAAAH